MARWAHVRQICDGGSIAAKNHGTAETDRYLYVTDTHAITIQALKHNG